MSAHSPNSPMETMRAAWGPDAPDWIVRLAEEAERTSQAKAAVRIGRSPALVSQTLHRRYTGDMGVVEELVRARIMGALVRCPSLGDLALSECRDWRAKAKAPSLVNAMRVRMFRACTRCPIYLEERGS